MTLDQLLTLDRDAVDRFFRTEAGYYGDTIDGREFYKIQIGAKVLKAEDSEELKSVMLRYLRAKKAARTRARNRAVGAAS